MKLNEMLQETTAFIKSKGVGTIDFGIILGSGLGELAEEIEEAIVIPYDKIRSFQLRQSLDMQVNLFTEHFQAKKYWRCKDVSIFMKVIRCKQSLILCE